MLALFKFEVNQLVKGFYVIINTLTNPGDLKTLVGIINIKGKKLIYIID